MQSDLFLICLEIEKVFSWFQIRIRISYNFIKLLQKYLVEYEIEEASNHDTLFQGFNFIYLGFWARNT